MAVSAVKPVIGEDVVIVDDNMYEKVVIIDGDIYKEALSILGHNLGDPKVDGQEIGMRDIQYDEWYEEDTYRYLIKDESGNLYDPSDEFRLDVVYEGLKEMKGDEESHYRLDELFMAIAAAKIWSETPKAAEWLSKTLKRLVKSSSGKKKQITVPKGVIVDMIQCMECRSYTWQEDYEDAYSAYTSNVLPGPSSCQVEDIFELCAEACGLKLPGVPQCLILYDEDRNEEYVVEFK